MELPYSLELAGPRTLASSGINQSSSKLLSSDHFRMWIFNHIYNCGTTHHGVQVYDAALCGREQQKVGASGGRQVLQLIALTVIHHTIIIYA